MELPMAKIDLPGKMPKSTNKPDTIKPETIKAMEDVTRLKKSIQDRIASVMALRDKFNKRIPTPPTKPMTTVTDKFANKRIGLIKLLEKVAEDPARYQSDLPTIREVVNQLEKLATTSSDRRSIKRFRLILKKLLVVVPIEEAMPSMEPTSKGIVIKRPPSKKLRIVETLVESIPPVAPTSKSIGIKQSIPPPSKKIRMVVPIEEALPSMEPKSKGIVIKRPSVNKEVTDNIAPVISKLQTDLEELRAIGVKSKYQTTKFLPNNDISNMVFLALLSKYNNPAIIIDVKQINPKYPGLLTDRIGIQVVMSPTDTDYDFNLDADYLGQQLQYFKNVGVEVICIPVSFSVWDGKKIIFSHANMTIYHPKLGMVEHFEPYGKSIDANNRRITSSINNSLSKLWNVKLNKWIGPIKYVPSSFVCRTYRGLQSLSGGAVCALWSCFIAEFALMNPMDTVMDMMEEILSIINDDAEYAKDIIYGYIEKAEELANKEWAVKYIGYTDSETDIPLIQYNTRLDITKRKQPITYNVNEYNKAVEKFESYYTFLEESIAKTKKTPSSIKELLSMYDRILKLVVTDEQRERLLKLKKLIPNTKKL
jgi:hypothetical protein